MGRILGAYRFALANDVPKLSYLTRLDWFLLVATTLVILTLFTMAFSAYPVSIGKEETAKRIDRVVGSSVQPWWPRSRSWYGFSDGVRGLRPIPVDAIFWALRSVASATR